MPQMGDGTFSETVTQSDSVISAVVGELSHAAVLVLSQFAQQLFSHGRDSSSLVAYFWDVPLGVVPGSSTETVSSAFSRSL